MKATQKCLDLGSLNAPLLVFGGPYSNLPAVLALKAEAERLRIPADHVICTGDVVAYCAQPEETVAAIRDWDVNVVMGNCEESLGSGASDCGCGFEKGTACDALSAVWYQYARRHVSEPSRQWMRELPRSIDFELNGRSFTVVHGAVSEISRFVFPSTPIEEKEAEINKANTDVVIGGHCGLPFGQRIGNRYWLNAGVIGMPANDGTKDGWYVLLTSEKEQVRVSWHRLGYPSDQAYQAMREARLAEGYAQSLRVGLWPSMDVLPPEERAQRGKAINLPSFLIP